MQYGSVLIACMMVNFLAVYIWCIHCVRSILGRILWVKEPQTTYKVFLVVLVCIQWPTPETAPVSKAGFESALTHILLCWYRYKHCFLLRDTYMLSAWARADQRRPHTKFLYNIVFILQMFTVSTQEMKSDLFTSVITTWVARGQMPCGTTYSVLFWCITWE